MEKNSNNKKIEKLSENSSHFNELKKKAEEQNIALQKLLDAINKEHNNMQKKHN